MLKPRVGIVVILLAAVFACSASPSPLSLNSFLIKSETVENETPIVGVLAQEVSNATREKYADRNITSYIAASYIKFVEGAGARAVPIWIGQSPEYYKDIVTKVNGVIFPGGASSLYKSDGYAEAGYHIYNAAIELNEQGLYFPVWGTCLGFELMTYLAANRTKHRKPCYSNKQPLALEFKEGYKNSRIFGSASSDILSILETQPVTANFHTFCITQKTFAKYGLDKDWNILSINHDWINIEFISTIEHKRYPFYGIQFHPEKNIYEFAENRRIPHSSESIRAGNYFADFFVNETRKNMNKFLDPEEETNSLIYNYLPEYTGKTGSVFVQQYLFERKNTTKTRSAVLQ